MDLQTGGANNNTTLDLDPLLKGTCAQIDSAFAVDRAERAFRTITDGIDTRIPFDEYRRLRVKYMQIDAEWAGMCEPAPAKIEQIVGDAKAEAQRRAKDALVWMLEARLAQIRSETLQSAGVPRGPVLGVPADKRPPAPDVDAIVESRRALEERLVADICGKAVASFNGGVDRHAAAAAARSEAAREKVKRIFKEKLDMAQRANASKFDRLLAAEMADARGRQYRTYGTGLQRKAERTEGEVSRAFWAAAARAAYALANPATYNRVQRLAILAVVLLLLGAVGAILWRSETFAAMIDPAERPASRVVQGTMVHNLRLAPVRPSYESHYRRMRARTEPAARLARDDLRRGFFEADGRNVSVAALALWLEETHHGCACAQHVGIDRFVAHVSGATMIDPALVTCSAETARARAQDWLGEGVYTVPLTARVEYSAGAGATAGQRTTAFLDRAGLVCVFRCADLARTPVGCPPKE